MTGRISSGPTVGSNPLPYRQHIAPNPVSIGTRESFVRILARDTRPSGKQALNESKWLEKMDIWYFDTKGTRKAKWFWIRVARNGTLVAKSSQSFEYYLHVLDDARAHGFDGKPRLGAPAITPRKPRKTRKARKPSQSKKTSRR